MRMEECRLLFLPCKKHLYFSVIPNMPNRWQQNSQKVLSSEISPFDGSNSVLTGEGSM